MADGTYWVYHYDTLGQVISGKRYWADRTLMAGQDFDCQFDDLGNRTETGGRASAVSDYTLSGYPVNRLNQYQRRSVPAQLDVLGLANPNAGVQVWKDSDAPATATQKGEYFHLALTVSPGTYPQIKAKSLFGATQEAIVGRSYVPPATEIYAYDTDGNLTKDGRWDYVWDGENRLVEMLRDTASPDKARQKLTFEYDHLGRRIRKTYFDHNGTTWVEKRDTAYLYDGWNMVAEVDANNANATLRTYVWGTDLSGNRTGAGGVGGLLWVNNAQSGLTAGIQFAAYDGNGNVAGLFAASDGSNTARYEYGPFGESLRMTGTLAKANPVRWSTKVTDDEGGLVYYGYRYYNPSTGRWPNRDPLGERGGLNLYGFVFNSPTVWIDNDGLAPQNWTGDDYIRQPHPDPSSPSGWRDARGRFMKPPGSPGSCVPTQPPGAPRSAPGGPGSGDTPAGAVAGALIRAAQMFGAGREQWQLNRFMDEGLKNCLAQAKQKGGCGGCCVVNLYLVTGKYDSYRNLFSGSSQFFSKPCFMVQADMAVIDSGPTLDPYFGRWDYENRWLYRLVHPDANQMRPIDNQSHIRRYVDLFSWDVK